MEIPVDDTQGPNGRTMILWRYILKAHLGPFVFANSIIIFLMLLQFLMKSAADLVGKGLGADIILELIVLNLAWILVLAVPMSVLVSTLMAFGRLSADNEATIMRASGMSLYRMMIPVLFMATLVGLGMVHFNNRILPEANIRLRTLMGDILRIKPTFSLRPGVFSSEQELPSFRILARRTFEKSNDLEGVTIYDLSRPEKSVVVTAVRGRVSFSPDYAWLLMDLSDGEIHEFSPSEPRTYRRVTFHRHKVSIPASGFGFQRTDASTAQRDDRTLGAGAMMGIVDSIRREQDSRRVQMRDRILRGSTSAFLPEPGVTFQALPPGSLEDLRGRASLAPATDTLTARARAATRLRQERTLLESEFAALSADDKKADTYLVEIHKKYSIPAACLIFVFIGAPLGMMARKGGFGMGAGLSLGFFVFYWACLIGGEKLADRALVPPFVGMWLANVVLGLLGAWLTIRSAREARIIDWSGLTRILPKRLRKALQGETP